jgi:hypothetical protein
MSREATSLVKEISGAANSGLGGRDEQGEAREGSDARGGVACMARMSITVGVISSHRSWWKNTDSISSLCGGR